MRSHLSAFLIGMCVSGIGHAVFDYIASFNADSHLGNGPDVTTGIAWIEGKATCVCHGVNGGTCPTLTPIEQHARDMLGECCATWPRPCPCLDDNANLSYYEEEK